MPDRGITEEQPDSAESLCRDSREIKRENHKHNNVGKEYPLGAERDFPRRDKKRKNE